MSFYKITSQHRRAIGSGDAAILYLHLEWKCNGGEYGRKDADLANEVGMEVRELKNATATLKQIGLINMVKRGCPPTWYYSVNSERMEQLIKEPKPEKSKKREVNQVREKGKFGPSMNRENGPFNEPLKRSNEEQLKRSNEEPLERPILNRENGPITNRFNRPSSLLSIDIVVDKNTDGAVSDFSEQDVQFFETPKPGKASQPDEPPVVINTEPAVKIPNAKVFDLPEFYRNDLLKNLTVGPLDIDWLFWLFDQERSSHYIEVALTNIRGADKALFEKNTALYVLYCGESRFRKNLTGYLKEKKYLETPIDRRAKAKIQTSKQAENINAAYDLYTKIGQMTKP